MGELLNRSWSILTDHPGLLWTELFAVLIPTLLLFIALGEGGLFGITGMMLQRTTPSPAELGGLRTGTLAAVLVHVTVLPYSVGGLVGTVLGRLQIQSLALAADPAISHDLPSSGRSGPLMSERQDLIFDVVAATRCRPTGRLKPFLPIPTLDCLAIDPE